LFFVCRVFKYKSAQLVRNDEACEARIKAKQNSQNINQPKSKDTPKIYEEYLRRFARSSQINPKNLICNCSLWMHKSAKTVS
jgi:hypothetical protein